jgi:hypothetical protein
MNDDNEIWDEFKWEEFMKDQDKKLDRYMELFYRYQDHPDCDEIIAREMGWTWLFDHKNEEESSELLAEETDGEEWKARSGIRDDDDEDEEEGQRFEIEGFRNVPVYQKAKAFAVRAMKFADSLPEGKRGDSSVVDFVSNAMIAPAKIVGGSGIGYEREELGGNIAYCKRGLHAANFSIAALREMKDKHIIMGEMYMEYMLALTEVRNLIAIHIIELRELFRRGV